MSICSGVQILAFDYTYYDGMSITDKDVILQQIFPKIDDHIHCSLGSGVWVTDGSNIICDRRAFDHVHLISTLEELTLFVDSLPNVFLVLVVSDDLVPAEMVIPLSGNIKITLTEPSWTSLILGDLSADPETINPLSEDMDY